MKIRILSGCLLLASLSTPAGALPQTRALMPQGLATIFSDADYPEEARRNSEQGTVAFLLDIGKDGRPTGCSITTSSGSSVLDAATCRIAKERPRFEPARDARGRATTDRISSRITWTLGDDNMSPPAEAAFMLWTSCLRGEIAKLVPGDLPADEVARRSFPPCEALEAILSTRTGGAAAPLPDTRRGMASMIERMITTMRSEFTATAPAGAPND
jgi:TonB family protein